MESSVLLEQLADDFVTVVPELDADAEHDRWQAGIGPFEEDRQIEMLREAIEGDTGYSIKTEEPYAGGGSGVTCSSKLTRQRFPLKRNYSGSATTTATSTRTVSLRSLARFPSEQPLLS